MADNDNAPTPGAGETERVRRRFILSGRVQGVGFRMWTARRARALNLSGSVRNCPDGTVEVEVAGDRDAVTRFRELLARGPDLAQVRGIREASPGPAPLSEDFRIAH